MTRSKNMEHVEALRELEQDGDAGLTEREREAIRQVIAALSAQQPAVCIACEGKPSGENNPCEVCGCGYYSSQQPAAVDGAMVHRAQEQISEGLGAYLRKFTDSEAAMRAREYLHKMPSGEWEG